MSKSVWIFQLKKDVARKGEAGASWYVGWYDLQGKRHSESCGPGSRGQNLAEKRLRRVQSELDIGVHQPASKKLWADFASEYEERILAGLAGRTKDAAVDSLGHFGRIARVARVESVTTAAVDQFVSKRRLERGLKPGSIVAPATINKDLRHLKAALRLAHEWGYLPAMPKVRMVKEPQKLPTFVTPGHFDLIYTLAAEFATLPRNPAQQYSPKDWWQAVTATAYLTGMRIGEILAVRREDIDFAAGELITRWNDTKTDRDEVIPLHAVVIEHLSRLAGDSPLAFPWHHAPRTLWVEFTRIQRAAGIHLPCRDQHTHTPSCHVYGFHDFRRAFATVNAPRLKPEVLQRLMRHKSYQTTQRFYINPTSQMQDAMTGMPLPEALKHGRAEPGTSDE